MALVVNSNIASLNAQRQLNSSTQALDQASERLASGQRINSAADDAAGLAISNRQTSQIRGLDQAIRNANDGSSLIQTAEGALQESTNILQRMRELSVQSSNGIYSDSDRNTLDAEVQQLVEELDRISETTSFNGQNILDGSAGKIDLQVGANAGETISFEIAETSTKSLGLGSSTTDLSGDRITNGSSIGQGDLQINGQALGEITNLQTAGAGNTSLGDVIEDINDNVDGVTASGYNVVSADAAGSGIVSATESLQITLSAVDGGADTSFQVTDTSSLEDLASRINDVTGGKVTATIDDSGKLNLSNDTGGAITVAYDDAAPFAGAEAGANLANITGITDAGADGTETFTGNIALSSDDGSEIIISTGADGTDADLNALGLSRVAGEGQVSGSALGATPQAAAIAIGDVKINGVDIGVVDQDAGLLAKVDAINAISSETGVIASAEAVVSTTFAGDQDSAQLTGTNAAAATGGVLTINGTDVTIAAGGLDAAVTAINAEAATTGVEAYLDDAGELNFVSEGAITLEDAGDLLTANGLSDGVTAAAPPSTGDLRINGENVSLTDLTDLDQVVTDINAASASTGVRASVDDNGELELKGSSGISLEAGDANGGQAKLALGIEFDTGGANAGVAGDPGATSLTVDAQIALQSTNGQAISVEVTDAGSTNTGLQNLNSAASATVTGSAISSISISTVSGAQDAIGSIDTALETINDTRSQLGAVSNRLDFTVSNLSNVSENTSAARSRVVDADFAAETAALSRAQVLQQASQSILAQANARPQQVLSLLQ